MSHMQIDMNVCSGCNVCEMDACLVNLAIHHDSDDNYYIDKERCTLCNDDESDLVDGLPNCVAYCPVPGAMFIDPELEGNEDHPDFTDAEDYENLGDPSEVDLPVPFKSRQECGYEE